MLLQNGKVIRICFECNSIYIGREDRGTCISCSSERTGYWENESIFANYAGTYHVSVNNVRAELLRQLLGNVNDIIDGKYHMKLFIATDGDRAIMLGDKVVASSKTHMSSILQYTTFRKMVGPGLTIQPQSVFEEYDIDYQYVRDLTSYLYQIGKE